MIFLKDGIDEDEKITLENIDKFPIDYLCDRFRIHVTACGFERGPEHGYFLAYQDEGPAITAAFADEAVVDLVVMIEGLDK